MLRSTALTLVNLITVVLSVGKVNANQSLDSNSPEFSVAYLKQELLSNIFTNYSKDVAPERGSDDIIDLNITFHMRNILALDEVHEVLTSGGWFNINWYDFRLTWSKSTYKEISYVHTSRSNVWVPDVTLDNTATQYKVLGHEDDILKITSEGLITWTPGDVFRTRCNLDNRYFPFDKQTCDVIIWIWTYVLDTVRIESGKIASEVKLIEEHGEWDMTSIDISVDNEFHRVSSATVHVGIQRRSTFYVFNIVLPVIVVTFLSAFVFLLPPESGERITLTTTLFLTYAVFLSYITNNMPTTSTTISFLGVFVAVQLVLNALSIMCTVIILKLHHAEENVFKIPSSIQDQAAVIGTVSEWFPTKRSLGRKLDRVFFVTVSSFGILATLGLIVILNQV